MTPALRGREGGWPKRDDSTDRLRERGSDKGGGGPKIGKFCGRHLWMAPKSLEGFLESGPQFILQSYILLRGEKLGYEDLTSVEASE